MAQTPVFASTPARTVGQVATGDTSRTAPSSVATIITAVSAGTKITEVEVVGTGTTTAGMVRLFIYDGSNYRLFDEFVITAITPSASVPVYRQVRVYPNLVLPSGYSLRATTHNTETFNVHVEAATLA